MEDENLEQEEKEQSLGEQAYNNAKKIDTGIKDTERAIENTKKAIEASKKAGSFIVKNIGWLKYVIIGILILIGLAIIITVLNGDLVDSLTGGDEEEAKIYIVAEEKISYPAKLEYRASENFDIKKAIGISEDGKNYTIDEEYVNDKLDKIENNGFDLKEFEFIQKDGSKDLFKKYIECNIKTMYPSIGSTSIDGKIKIKRDTDDSGLKDLKYLPYNELKSMVDSKNLNSLNYFTINMTDPSNPLLCYATSDITHYYTINKEFYKTEVNSITLMEEPYKYLIEPYCMPYEFLVILHIASQEKEFMESVVNLLDQYEATITLKDTVYTRTTTIDYTGSWYQVIKEELNYTKIIETIVKVESNSDVASTEELSHKTDYIDGSKTIETKEEKEISNGNISEYYGEKDFNTINSINERITTEKELTYVNSWIATTTNTYTKGKTDEITELDSTININTPSGETDIKYDGKSYIEVDKKYVNSPSQSMLGQALRDFINSQTNSKTTIRCNNWTRTEYQRTEIKERTVVTSKNTEYTSQNINTQYNLENENGFIDILKNSKYAWSSLYSGDEWFLEQLNAKQATQDLEQVMRYVFYLITNNANYGVTDINRLTQMFDTSDFIPIGGSDFSLKADTSDIQVIKDVQKLKLAFSGYANSSKLQEKAEFYLKMQEKYNVNAIFAAAVAITETTAGTAGFAVKDGKNNWYNIECHCGNSAHGRFESYSNAEESIEAFFKLISGSSYYFKGGNTTIYSIGMKYCENAEQDWIPNTTAFMAQMYEKVGISISKNTTTVRAVGKVAKMIEWAEAQVGKSQYIHRTGGIMLAKGYCAAFVSNCYYRGGFTYLGGNAKSMGNLGTKHSITRVGGKIKYDEIPLCACLVSEKGAYGHVAIYVGNGYVIEAGVTPIRKISIDKAWKSSSYKYWALGKQLESYMNSSEYKQLSQAQ